jgi:predicted ATPase/DNA-binding CsgD family transcriptional regulator
VGRAPELEHLELLLAELGDAACLAIEGEPGIGKTHLLAELRRRADERGMLVLSGTAAEFERDVPFALWTDALDAYVVSQDPDELVPAAARPELGGVLPSLSVTEQPPAVDERYRTHRAARALLERIADGQPLTLILDDLHWADQASLELIASLLKRPPAAPVLLALGFRSGQAPPTLAATLAEPLVRRLQLAPLDEAGVRELLGAEVEERRLATIRAETGGNPLYALQLARAVELPAQSSSSDRVGDEAGVPSLVAAALLAEVQELPAGARDLLEAASVAGDPFEPELAFAIAGMEAGAGMDALDELLPSGLVRATDVPRQFAFRHPLVRRAVYESTKGGWRLGAHARAAEALTAAGASAPARAHHVEQSAAQGDTDAVAVLVEAAQASASRAPAAAVRWFDAALRLLPEDERQTRLGMLVLQAQALRATGDRERCREALLGALELLPSDQAAMRVALTAACAFMEDALGRHEESRSRLDRALAELPEDCARERVEVLLNLAAGAFFTQELERMRETAEEAVAAMPDLGDPGLELATAAMLSHADVLLGRGEEARPHLDRGAELMAGLTDLELAPRIEAVNRLGWAELYLERFDEAIVHLERGMAISRTTGQSQFIPYLQQALALAEAALGNRDAALQLNENAVESARLMNADYVLASALSSRGGVAMMSGDLEIVIPAAREALALLEGMERGVVAAVAGCGLAAACVEAGEIGADLDSYVEVAGGWEMPLLAAAYRAQFQEVLTRGWLAAGELERARESAARAEVAATELGLGMALAQGWRARAAVLLAEGQDEEAAELALRSAQSAADAGARVEAARSRALAGRALAASDERERALELLREAEAELDACGAARPREEARRELRRLGGRVEPRGPAAGGDGLGSLTKREREVADLVTARKTNKQIAADLFLSEKTVESHLRNVFFKLGVSSRVEVAEAVERDGD